MTYGDEFDFDLGDYDLSEGLDGPVQQRFGSFDRPLRRDWIR